MRLEVTQYAESVLDGERMAGPHVRAACERHWNDLKRSDLVFSQDRADYIGDYFEEHLTLHTGEFEGMPFILAPWQQFVVGSMYGWKYQNGIRRFRKAYIETAKGSGKSPLVAGLGLYSITSDDEPRAEGYIIARTAEQAAVTFRSVVAMVRGNADLDELLIISGGQNPYNVADPSTVSFLRRVSTERSGKGKSGPLPSLIICDEYHEHDTSDMLDFFTLGVKHRREPMTIIITNAGAGMGTPCGIEHTFAVHVANEAIENDAYFSYVCALDEEDEPFDDESCWPKAHPGLQDLDLPGYDYIRQEVAQSKGMPSKRALTERLIFCRWTDAESPWLSRERWIKVEVPELKEDEIRDKPCYLALDLSLKTDLCGGAVTWDLSPGETDEKKKRYASSVVVWTPEETLADREKTDNAPYTQWEQQGYLTAVPGSVIDFEPVVAWIREIMDTYHLQGIAYDPWRIDLLEEEFKRQGIVTTKDPKKPGLLLAPHPQGFRAGFDKIDDDERKKRSAKKKKKIDRLPLWMPRSIDAIEDAILEKKIQVKKSPPLRWAALGTVVVMDASNNRRVQKQKSTSRIDAMVALTMSVGFAKVGRPLVKREGNDYILTELYKKP